jgi:calcium/calmodulin-dependent protein kinase I
MSKPSPLGRLLQGSLASFVLRDSPDRPRNVLTLGLLVANMLNKLSGQPGSYEKKYRLLILAPLPHIR